MIIITVKVPIMEAAYDFQIDEDIPFHYVRKEIANAIIRKNQCLIQGDTDELSFWDSEHCRRIDMLRTAYENDLRNGSELIMV